MHSVSSASSQSHLADIQHRQSACSSTSIRIITGVAAVAIGLIAGGVVAKFLLHTNALTSYALIGSGTGLLGIDIAAMICVARHSSDAPDTPSTLSEAPSIETQQAGLSNPEKRLRIQGKLHQWIEESPAGEKEGRKEAKTRILSCYDNQTRKLLLSNLGLTSIPDIFEDLTHLEHLSLYGNDLSNLPEENLRQLNHLQVLNLAGNPRLILSRALNEWVESRAIANPKHAAPRGARANLDFWVGNCAPKERADREAARERIEKCYQNRDKSLSLNDLSLTSLPEGIEMLTQLQILAVNADSLQEQPDAIQKLANLKIFHFRGKTPLELSSGILNWISERRIILTIRSKKVELSSEMTDRSLIAEKLDHWAKTTREFQRVQKEVKAEIMSCYDEKKTDLYLSRRILSSLPDVFDHLTQLRKVVLTSNFLLEELPESFAHLSK